MNQLNETNATKCLETIEDFVKAVPVGRPHNELGHKKQYAEDALEHLYSLTKEGYVAPTVGCTGKKKD